jgi:hypothetical protein
MTIETDEDLAIEYLGCEAIDRDGVIEFVYVEPGSDRETECITALCRLLSNINQEISFGLRMRLATLFDPKALIERRQLVMQPRRRGGPNEPSDARNVAIARYLAAEVNAGEKLDSAVRAAELGYGVSRSTVMRAWRDLGVGTDKDNGSVR